MKAALKPCFLLLSLVLGIYVMRHSDVSVGGMVKRVLQDFRPSAQICKGTELSQVFTATEIERANSFKSALESSRGGNPLLKIMTSGDLFNGIGDYAMGLIPMIAPWAVFFVISFIAMIVIVCNWCCIYGCCKNGKSCKCCKAPKTSARKRIYIAISAIFLLGNMGAGIAGVIVAGGVPKGMELMICSLISVVEDLNYGVPADKWLGVKPIVTNLNTLYTYLDNAVNSLSTSSNSISAIGTAKNNVETRIDTMLTAIGTPSYSRVAPDQTGTYTPTYISNIGPKTDMSTMTGMILKECEIKYDLLNTAQPLINGAITALKTPPGIGSQIVSAKNMISGYSNSLNDVLVSIGDFGEIGKSAISGVGAGLTAIFAANIAFAVFGIGSMIMIGCLKFKSFNKFLHFSWMGFTIFAILGFLLSTLLYPLTVVLMETCGVLEVTLPDPDSDKDSRSTLQQFFTSLGLKGDVKNLAEFCMDDSPTATTDMMSFFNLDTVLADFDTIYDNFNAISAVMPIENTAPPSLTIPPQVSMVQKMKTGEWADAPETIVDLTALNSATNQNNFACTTVFDNWRLNSANCSSSDGTKFVSTDGDTSNRGNPTCIGLDAWTTPAHDINNRYTSSEFGTCSNKGGMAALTYVQNFIPRFKTNRASIETLFTSIETHLNDNTDSVHQRYNLFADKIKLVLNDFSGISSALVNVRDVLNGETTGILKNLKCKFMQSGLKRMRQSMCTGFVSSLYQTSVIIIIVSFFSLFSAIFVFCLAKRMVIEEPETKGKPV